MEEEEAKGERVKEEGGREGGREAVPVYLRRSKHSRQHSCRNNDQSEGRKSATAATSLANRKGC